MMNNKYIGHSSQVSGVEEHRLVGGKADGMRMLEVRNGLGLDFTVSIDRAADISRLFFKGDNYGYFSPCGYVAPEYYDDKGDGFLKSFTAGFLTTCGLTTVGIPCVDDGQELPLHGTVNSAPAEYFYYVEDAEKIVINATINQAKMFSEKLMMYRKITCSKVNNTITIEDTIENIGDRRTPLMFLYHVNIGYPLLSEKAELVIPSNKIIARNAHAEKDIETWNKIIEPQPQFEEQCYYHNFESGNGVASIFNSSIEKGLSIKFDAKLLDHFIEWKMMGYKDYVLGLEPANCHTDGRDVMRKEKTLKFIEAGEKVSYKVEFDIIENVEAWIALKGE